MTQQSQEKPGKDSSRPEYYGPMFLKSHETNNDGSIYDVDASGILPQNVVAVMARKTNPDLVSLLTGAMHDGKAVSVAPSGKYWVEPGKLGWEIYKAKIEY
jgi:hypothetical protein